MDGFGPRRYRDSMGEKRFAPFIVSEDETDLWVGVDIESCKTISEHRLVSSIKDEITRCRALILSYDRKHHGFIQTLTPVVSDPYADPLISAMITAGIRADVGPMGAVAGTIARFAGERIIREFSVQEVVVENGGDIFIQIVQDLDMSIYAGSSPLSERLGVTIPSGQSPLGVCTSAGTVGPSFSQGSADAVMIACSDTSSADAYATAYGNMVQKQEDVDRVISLIRDNSDILSAVIIKDDKAGICGEFKVNVQR